MVSSFLALRFFYSQAESTVRYGGGQRKRLGNFEIFLVSSRVHARPLRLRHLPLAKCARVQVSPKYDS